MLFNKSQEDMNEITYVLVQKHLPTIVFVVFHKKDFSKDFVEFPVKKIQTKHATKEILTQRSYN